MLFAQTAAPNVNVTPSGNWADPGSWATFVEKVGIPVFLMLVAFVVAGLCLWMFFKQRGIYNGPTNEEQLEYLHALYRASRARDARIRRVMVGFCSVVRIFAESTKVDVSQDLRTIQDTLLAEDAPEDILVKGTSSSKPGGTA